MKTRDRQEIKLGRIYWVIEVGHTIKDPLICITLNKCKCTTIPDREWKELMFSKVNGQGYCRVFRNCSFTHYIYKDEVKARKRAVELAKADKKELLRHVEILDSFIQKTVGG